MFDRINLVLFAAPGCDQPSPGFHSHCTAIDTPAIDEERHQCTDDSKGSAQSQ